MAERIGKEGSIQDIFYIGAVLLFFAIVLLLGYKITGDINTEIQGNELTNSSAQITTASTTLTNYYPGILDNMFLVLVVVLSIGAFVLAALVRIHPIFIALFFMVWLLLIFFCGVLSNIYQEMAANTALVTEANQLVITSNVMTYLPLIIGTIGIVLMIVMYKTYKNDY